MKRYKYLILIGFIYGSLLSSCEDFLDEKPSMSIAAVETVKDMQLLMDDIAEINQCVSGLIEMGSDDYYVDYTTLMSRPIFEQDVYYWRDPYFLSSDLTLHWVKGYKPIMVANVVLESLDRLAIAQQQDEDFIRGQALFIRGFAYTLLSQIYAIPYRANDNHSAYGLVMRSSSDINNLSKRMPINASYEIIIDDLKKSAELLPMESEYKTRPSKLAAYAVLARVYLSMEDYVNAGYYADLVLESSNDLLDFNKLNSNASFPIEVMNKETLYFSMSTSALLLAQSRANVSEELLSMYHEDDLRKKVYFYKKTNGSTGFKGAYTGNASALFAGPTVDEMYLIKSECLIRNGHVSDGLVVLNTLLKSRWKTDLFHPIIEGDRQKALSIVLDERRKELVYRGLRWSDLRRLNDDPNYSRIISRHTLVNGQLVKIDLLPNSNQYTYLIPSQVVDMNGVIQNPR